MARLLGEIAFSALGTADSGVYHPDRNCTRYTLQCTPSATGTVQVYFVDSYDGDLIAIGSAVAVAANAAGIFVIEFPTRDAFSGAFLRYTNTSNASGTARFSAAG